MNKTVDIKKPLELYQAGYDALVKEIGAAGAIGFIRLFDKGYGDSVKEKYERKDMSMDEIAKAVYKMQGL